MTVEASPTGVPDPPGRVRRTGLAVAVLVVVLLSIPAVIAVAAMVTAGRPVHHRPDVTDGPTPTTTGVPGGTGLIRHDGNLTITTAGAVYDSIDVHGFVFVEAADVTIRRSIIRGGVATTSTGLVNITKSWAKNFVITDSELVPAHPSVFIDGIQGRNYTALRLDIQGTVDGAKVVGNDVTIANCYIHNLTLYQHDPYQGGGPSHNDGIQVLGGRHIRITANTIDIATNLRTALEVSQDDGATSDLVFADNRAQGGTCTVNLTNKPMPVLTGITIRGNHFGGETPPDCAIVATANVRVRLSANVMEVTGLPARITIVG